jgi:hypothetical protein
MLISVDVCSAVIYLVIPEVSGGELEVWNS